MVIREHGYLFVLLTRSDLRARRLYTICRDELDREDRVVFAHRYTTNARLRPYSVALAPEEFAAREDYGCFSFSWNEQGERHAAGIEIDRWLDSGLNVLLTVGRSALPELRQRFGPRLRVVFAPTPKGNGAWFDLARGARPAGYSSQLGLGLEIDTNRIDDELETALNLSEDLDEAVSQLAHALRQQTPPLVCEDPQPVLNRDHASD